MKHFSGYLEEKMGLILYNICLILIVLLFLNYLDGIFFGLLLGIMWLVILIIYLIIEYLMQLKKDIKVRGLIDALEEKYFIAEILPKPTKMTDSTYYYVLKSACKSMNDKISTIYQEKENYQEYIEMWIHEIKTPISAISLLAENHHDLVLLAEISKINRLVEQVLFYARSQNLEKDYFVSCNNLSDIIHNSIIDFKKVFLENKVGIKVHNVDDKVYCDEKWVHFVLSQIIQNSLKYFDKENKQITFSTQRKENGVYLSIEDNGIGIETHNLMRLFDYGFTGNDRQKGHSTGIGLYLCKKLCDKQGIDIFVESSLGNYTKVILLFPINNLYLND